MASADLRDELLCSICLSIFKDPVTLRCGHNFCQVCIDRVLDTQDESGVFSCPECRDEFQERPALMRNINLHNVAERFLITQQEQEEITGICCTYCVDSPVPAVRSCLHCEASLCEKHLRAHSKSPEHVLSDPSTSLEKRKCPVHKKILEYYCTEDAACICVSCSLIGKHNEHKMESLDEASEKKKKKLRNVLQKLTTKREETEERVRSLEERRRKAQEKAAGEAERVTALCTDIRRRVDDLEKKVLSEISMREKQKSMSLSVVIHKLEIKKDELSRKMRHIEELCNMTDPLTVLQEPDTGDLCDFEEEGGDEDTGGHDKQLHDGGDLDVAVISHTLHTLCEVITGIRSGIYVEDPADILLDVNSAGNYVLISDDLKTVTWAEEEQNRPETAERFLCNQVMSRRGFTSGRHYWDVEGSGSGWWRVGMCYPSIDRKESQSLIGAMASADLNDELLCSICLSIFKDPVTLRCGHNFCRVCIDRALDTQDGSGVYSCPECREEFQERPALMRNLYLHNVTERFMITQQEQKITGIYCTYCVDSPVPAVRSCLHCEASLCEKHLRTHSKSPEHVLSDPSTSLEKRKCSVHKKILEYYCTEDAACICVSCSLIGKHKGHKMESLDEASEKKKKKLSNVLQKLTTKREKTEERVRSLKERWRKAQEKAAGEAERVTALCTDIRRLVDDLEKKVLSEISRQEKEESRSLSALIKLEIKKDELSRKMRHIEELCNMTDPLTVLQEPDTGDLCDPEEEGGDEDTGGHDKQLHDGDDLDVTVISHTLHTLCEVITGIRRGIYVEDPADILLDVNTAGNDLLISDDLKTATWTQNNQNRPETAERFQYNQVMSRRGFTSGRHYWDVEGSRSGGWSVGMCYPSIDRRGEESLIGNNNKSWSLRRYNNQYSVIHDSIEIQLPNKISSDRVRICLDYGAGQLSFYELCDPIRHLHTFTAAFSEPLHAALCVFWMYNDGHYIDSWVKIRT
ncbi:E3 ubiquitin/ISG15 ligase TRIM25-like [Anomaloglossus baeobatrachus]